MTQMEMRGPRQVRHAVSEFLRSDLPVRIPRLRVIWDLLDAELPVPDPSRDPKLDAYVPREPSALDRWPLIAVTSGRLTGRKVDTNDVAEPQYGVRYPIRVFSWVRSEGWETTQDMRDDMATAVRIALLSRPLLLAGTGLDLRVDESTLTTDFSEVTPVKGERFVAGSYVGFDLQATETLTDRLAFPNGGQRVTVSDVTTTGSTLPVHPALL